MNKQTAILLYQMLPLLFIYVFGLVLPYRTRKELVFSIRFPMSFAQSEQILSLKKQYLKLYGITGELFYFVFASAILLWPNALFPAAVDRNLLFEIKYHAGASYEHGF